jgi:SAM-dependent methyltransferase
MSDETKKAMVRRKQESFMWDDIFQGRGIDIGCGPDKLPFAECRGFDMADGDANYLSKYVPTDHYDYIHASQCLEHMHDPTEAMKEWLKVLKPGGYAVISVPDFVLYEQLRWPSLYNPDHKSSWSLHLPDSPAPIHVLVPNWIGKNFPDYKVWKLELIDTNYNYKLIGITDQTWTMGAEAFIEFVLQKP